MNWKSAWTAWIASLVAPPAGIVLHWLRPNIGIVKKVSYSLLVAVWGVKWLILFFGLRVEADGTGIPKFFTFRQPETHYAILEQSRARQAVVAPVVEKTAPEPTPAPAVVKPAAGFWPDFRGPNRDGHYTETPLLTPWPATGLKRLWQQPAGGGYASFVVAEGRLYTIEQRRRREVVAAYDINTGRELWSNSWEADFRESMGGDGPRATPTWHEGRLYALGAQGEFRCLEAASGKTLWRRNILQENAAQNLQWGMAASPLIVDEKVIVLPGGGAGKSVAAYHKLTGEPVWKALNDKQAYTAPMLVTLAGKRQIVVVSAERAMGLTTESGDLLWEYPWKTEYDVNAAQPIVAGPSRLFVSAGYGHGAAVIEIGISGDKFEAKTVWSNNRMKNKFSGAVLFEGHIYGLDEAILACINAETGELKWKGGRYGYGQVLLASGHLVITTETGDLVLVKATPESHQELSRFPALSGKTWNVPALAGGKLFVRNATGMMAFAAQ
ncbi:MAG: PQQ-like beta-propeller repeat protein [Candidatus Solibacter usitatus]|nr:PQQ-like beta-propeller repeat protein [Candidatus Solibacter usitatus]